MKCSIDMNNRVGTYNYKKFIKKIKSLLVSFLLLSVLLVGLLTPSGEVEAISYTLRVDDPNGGEMIYGGSVFVIRLYSSSSGGVLVVSYSTDGGATYPNEISTVSNSGGTTLIDWYVPNNVDSTSARVRAEWRSDAGPSGITYRTAQSAANFTLQTNTVLSFLEFPGTMSHGRYELIKWNLQDPAMEVGALNIQVRYRTGSTWEDWTSLTGTYANIPADQGGIWFMPSYYESAYGQVKLRAYTSLPGGTLLMEIVSDEFVIDSPWIQLMSPNGGQALVAGDPYEITWATANDPTGIIIGIGLQYSVNSGSSWNFITMDTANDFSYLWTVPAAYSDDVRVKVIAHYSELDMELASDMSDGDCRIVGSNEPSISLIAPNPYVPGAIVLFGGETTIIRWSVTNLPGAIDAVKIRLSTDGGTSYGLIATTVSSATTYSWTVPMLDTRTAKIQIEMDPAVGSSQFSESANPFYIFTETAWNRPPVAMAPNSLSAQEGALVTLDGSDSYDPDEDALFYYWEQVDSLGFDVELSDPYDDNPTFRASIGDYSVSLVFQLTVSDGEDIEVEHYTDHIKRTSVLITPSGPTITGFTPAGGYEGTDVCITGTNLMGGQIRIGGVLTATITGASPANPDPDESFNFTLVAGIPPLPATITVTTAAGTAESEEDFEVYPYPWYSLDYGFTFGNCDKDYLSYPWLFWESGDYQRTFGDDVYLSLWICLGIPYWTPSDGWECWGYMLSQPICPDPLAALWYGIAYCHLAQGGECFGLSAVNLELYLDQLQPNEIQPGVYDIDDLENIGALRTRVDYMHGSQVSAECCHYWVAEHLYNLVPAIYGVSGMGLVLKAIENSIDDGDLGIISIVDGSKGHILVPYATVNVDSDTTRVYVWDINKPEWSTDASAEAALQDPDANMNHPPYIEIDRDGAYWEWSYYFGPGQGWWGGSMGLTFVHSDTVLGDRSLPTTLDGLFSLVFGCASGSVEDDDGNVMELLENGTYRMEIEGGSPFTLHSGLAGGTYAYYLPNGNYTTHISGHEEGLYNCTLFVGNKSAYAIENAGAENGTEDSLRLWQKEGNPFLGRMTYRTSDEEKRYSATMIKQFGERDRVFKILNATIFDDSMAVINTTDDCGKLIFHNDGPHRFTFDVRFQGNVLCEEAWERLNGTLTDIPTCEAFGIEIGPDETLTIYPSDWLDLEAAEVIVEREGGDGFDIMLLVLVIGIMVVAVAAVWYLIVRRRRKG